MKRKQSSKEKILIAFFIYSTISFLVAVTSFLLFKDLERIDIVTHEVHNIHGKILDALRLGQDFFIHDLEDEGFYLTGNTPSVRVHTQALEQVTEQVRQIREKEEITNPEILQDLGKLEKMLVSYEVLYAQILQKIRFRGFGDYGLNGDMARKMNTLENTLPRKNNLILAIQGYEKRYLLTKDSNNIAQVKRLSSQLKTNISRYNFSSFQKNRLLILLDDYLNILQKIVQINKKLGFSAGSKGITANLKQKTIEIRQLVAQIDSQVVKKKFDLNTKVQVILVSIITLSIIMTLFLSLSFKFVLGQTKAATVQ